MGRADHTVLLHRHSGCIAGEDGDCEGLEVTWPEPLLSTLRSSSLHVESNVPLLRGRSRSKTTEHHETYWLASSHLRVPARRITSCVSDVGFEANPQIHTGDYNDRH